jgi:hypothetical protein
MPHCFVRNDSAIQQTVRTYNHADVIFQKVPYKKYAIPAGACRKVEAGLWSPFGLRVRHENTVLAVGDGATIRLSAITPTINRRDTRLDMYIGRKRLRGWHAYHWALAVKAKNQDTCIWFEVAGEEQDMCDVVAKTNAKPNKINVKFGPAAASGVDEKVWVGTIVCSLAQLQEEVRGWISRNPHYHLLGHNCQHFVTGVGWNLVTKFGKDGTNSFTFTKRRPCLDSRKWQSLYLGAGANNFLNGYAINPRNRDRVRADEAFGGREAPALDWFRHAFGW